MTAIADQSEVNNTKTPWRALTAAWLGWAFDGLDGFLFVMVGRPFVQQLVAREHGIDPKVPDALKPITDEITLKFTLIGAVFLVGWAIGGAVFGRLGDRLGRARTLTLTVLTYALFTGLCYFSQTWWHLMIFRFIAALGIGGEWAAGSALVSETLPKRHRHWASAALQSGYMIGCISAALTSRWMSNLGGGWERYVFLVGVIPALMTVWIRWAVPEPEQWKQQAAVSKPPPVSAVFSRGLWRTTVLTIFLAGVPLTTVWAFWLFLPEVIRAIPEVAAWTNPKQTQTLIVNVTILSLLFNIVGNFVSTYLARFVGYRASFTIMFVAGLACFLIGFRHPPTLGNIYPVACITSFFILGVFGMFPLYIPRLFPTLLRTLGCGITYNTGRLLAAVGTFGAGTLAIKAGGASGAMWWIGMLYIPGIAVALMCVLPKDEDSGMPLSDTRSH